MNTNNEPTQPKTADEVRALLVQKRKKLNLTQFGVAKLVNESSSANISNIENGKRGIPKEKVALFAKAYQLTEETLATVVTKRGRIRGRADNDTLNLDVLPFIKKIATSNREKLTVAELKELINGYAALQKSVEDLAPELRDLLLGTLEPPKTSQ